MFEPKGRTAPSVIDRNIEALLSKRRENERRRSLQDRIADRVTAFTGSMAFVYLHIIIFGGWILANTTDILPLKPFDPSLVILAMAASVEAIFLSTFVLISQNRMQRLADERADLNLHISLLAEHEITRLVRLVSSMAARLGIEESRDPTLPELQRDVLPENVLEKMEQHKPE